ncbi:MAG: DUF2207 domain-containing protein [Patescibacteria group bacterium]|jgi:uncharacterized membrane protein
MFKKFILLVFIFIPLFAPLTGRARENVTDWYIKDFQSEIIVNKDSSLDITENIIADCGNASDKHGIFRILPDAVRIESADGKITAVKTPVELIGITDFEGHKLKYKETKNFFDKTITWKIGDPDIEVSGVNYYRIKYRVKNAIRFNDDFDELYWNLSGNFWDLEIDNFQAKIILPSGADEADIKVDYYAGALKSKAKDLAAYQRIAPDTLEFRSKGTLKIGEGITASVIFPKNIFTPYEFSFLEIYGKYLWPLIPLFVFFVGYYFWRKYGRDPRVDKTVIPEYEAPENLTPLETGMLMTNGIFSNKLVTAEIINLAAKGLLSVKEIEKKVLMFSSRDYELTKKPDTRIEAGLNAPQKAILENVFKGGDSVKLSDLKNEFYKSLAGIKSGSKKLLSDKGLIAASGSRFQVLFIILGVFLVMAAVFSGIFQMIFFAAGLFSSALIIFIFAVIMPKRTPEGAEANWKIKGFKLFMETVDKHRAEFYEKENIFEKFLPYAIVFGITGLWIKKMKEIYGEKYFNTYAPAWYAGHIGAFDADSFNKSIESLSSAIAANTSAPSGGGGAGGAGGGGGGGGGGGW